MLFHSVTFFLFFAIFLAGFALFKNQGRIVYTTIASFIFYAWWYPPYLLLLLGFIAYAFIVSQWVEKCGPRAFGFIVFATSLPLCFFKYTGFVLENVLWLAGSRTAHVTNPWHLPLGISFITFTVLAYFIDIRRRQFKRESGFFNTALYVSFFPHLIAGPIMRPKELFPQFKHLRLKPQLVTMGILLFSIGMIKKIVFADQLAPWANRAFDASSQGDWLTSLIGFYAFAIQIYCDFSGYTDMALGVAFVLGIRLPLNFNRPYLSASIREFWRRWHITLSRWLRDYLYISLGGSRRGILRTCLALMATMLIGGLWHGATWLFVLWGGYHGILLVAEHLTKRNTVCERIPAFVRRLVTFHAVCIGWVFFRSRDLASLKHFAGNLFSRPLLGESAGGAPYAIGLMAVFFILLRWDRASLSCWAARHKPKSVLLAVSLILIITSLAVSVGNPGEFIYFDF